MQTEKNDFSLILSQKNVIVHRKQARLDLEKFIPNKKKCIRGTKEIEQRASV